MANILRVATISVGVIILLLQLFLLTNAEKIYGNDAPKARKEIEFHLFLQMAILSAFAIPLPTINVNPTSFINFIVGFTIFSVVVLIIPKFIPSMMGSVAVTALGYGIIHSFVKAYTEEVVFRAILPSVGLGTILSNVLFGVFHLLATDANIAAMLFLTALGFVFTFFKRYLGTMGAVGAHVAYNSWVMGILDKVFGVV